MINHSLWLWLTRLKKIIDWQHEYINLQYICLQFKCLLKLIIRMFNLQICIYLSHGNRSAEILVVVVFSVKWVEI